MISLLDQPRSSTIYKIAGTKTFRLGSAKILGEWGENMQNKDKDIRYTYLSDGWDWRDKDLRVKLDFYNNAKDDTGNFLHDISIFSDQERDRIKMLVQVDQSGAEALIVSYLCRAGKFRDLFTYGVKPHVFVALHVFADEWRKRCSNLDIDVFLRATPRELRTIPGWKELDKLIKSSDNWKASERFYYIAKMICHASNYGMKGPTFALNVLEKSEGKIRLTTQQASKYLNAYHYLFPEIHQWHNTIQYMLQKDKSFLRNLFGFPREFNGVWGDNLFKEAYAYIPQSTVGTITNVAKTQIQELIEERDIEGVDLLQNGHDSILAQCRIGDEKFVAQILRSFIECDLVNLNGERFKMKSEAGIGFNWGPHKKTNPLGMNELSFAA